MFYEPQALFVNLINTSFVRATQKCDGNPYKGTVQAQLRQGRGETLSGEMQGRRRLNGNKDNKILFMVVLNASPKDIKKSSSRPKFLFAFPAPLLRHHHHRKQWKSS